MHLDFSQRIFQSDTIVNSYLSIFLLGGYSLGDLMISLVEIVGPIPLLVPCYDESKGKKLYPLNPAAIPREEGVELIVRWISYRQNSYDPTERIGVYHMDWDFQNIKHKGDLMFPEMNDKNIVNPVEDVRAGLPDKSGETYVCYNYLRRGENGETLPGPVGATLTPPYKELEDVDVYGNQIGKNVLPLSRNENEREVVFRLVKHTPVFRYIKKSGGKTETRDEEIKHRPYWASQNIGFTGLPIELSDESKLFILHGVQVHDRIYEYSIGTAVWKSGKWIISEEPFLTPKMIREKLKEVTDWTYEELRPEGKKVIYSGAIIPRSKEKLDNVDKMFNVDSIDKVDIPLNLGDTAVVMVELLMEDLLDFSEPLTFR